MSSLSLSTAVHVFPCPNCSETINTSMPQCPFCSTAIDLASAETASAETSRISQACSDASYLKIMLGVLIPFGLLVFFPFMGLLGLGGFIFIKYAVVVMTVRWWWKYRSVKSNDPDFSNARGTVIFVSAVAFLVVLLLHARLFGLPL